jgi:hypothetical protein
MPRKKKEPPSFTMPTDPNDLRALRNILLEMSGCLQFIKDRREVLKDLALSVEERFKIPKEVAAEMGKTFFKGDFEDKKHKNEIFQEVYERAFDDLNQGDVQSEDSEEVV